MNTRSQTTPDISVKDLDLDELLRDISVKDCHVARSENAQKALNNRGMSKEHWKRSNETKQSFLDGLENLGEFYHFVYFIFSFLHSSSLTLWCLSAFYS